jgi:L-amino acid N-acyltransferase YncA
VLIRPATPADAPSIASILNALLATTTIEWTDTPHTPDGILRWLADHEVSLVAEDDGAVVGVAAFGWSSSASTTDRRRRRAEATASPARSSGR